MAAQKIKAPLFLKILSLVSFAGVILLSVTLIFTIKEIQTLKATSPSSQITSVTYSCSNNKTIRATYLSNSVELTLSDGRNFLLPQGLSASGIRYTNDTESVTFWSKGNTAFLQEGQTITYNACIVSSH